MRKIVLLIAILGISCLSFSQEKKQSIVLGINGMRPNFLDYNPKIGFQVGYGSEKPFSKAFSFQKEVCLTMMSFDYHEPKTVLNLKNTTYALDVPLSVKWYRPKFIQPYIGVAGTWNFNSHTEYYVEYAREVNISRVGLSGIAGLNIPLSPKTDFDIKFSGHVNGENEVSTGFYGWRFSLKYVLGNVANE